MRNIKFISYDGKWPTLCHGKLVLSVDNEIYTLNDSLISGGIIINDPGYFNFEVKQAPWIVEFNDNYFTKEEQEFITQLVNENVPWGCCGGCI